MNMGSVACYDAGDRPVPPVVLDRLAKLLAQRQAEIAKLQPKVAAAGQGADHD